MKILLIMDDSETQNFKAFACFDTMLIRFKIQIFKI